MSVPAPGAGSEVHLSALPREKVIDSAGIDIFSANIDSVLGLHVTFAEAIQKSLNAEYHTAEAHRLIEKHNYELFSPLHEIEDAYAKFISVLSKHSMQREAERRAGAEFHGERLTASHIEFLKTKLILENIASFLKSVVPTWAVVEGRIRNLSANPETHIVRIQIEEVYLQRIWSLNATTEAFIERLKEYFHAQIIGSASDNPNQQVSNLLFDPEMDYDYRNVFEKKGNTSKAKTISNIPGQESKSKTSRTEIAKENFFFTNVYGTKEWNRNDCYVLDVKKSEFFEEEEKFNHASFVILGPGDNTNLTLASALVRKNSGHGLAGKYFQMVQALFEFTITNIFSKDFPEIKADQLVMLYHIGPVAIFNIITDDMKRRNFGHIFYVEKNNLVKLFPENIIKKHTIDLWEKKFQDLNPISVDSYIDYSKSIQVIRTTYQELYNHAAATRKGALYADNDFENYLQENCGKFFGFRRAQIFRRFVPGSVFSDMPEIITAAKITRFF